MSDDTIPDRTAARAALLAELDRLSDHGNPPPCWTVALPERGCFTSDDDSEQALAARMCRPCPAVEPCQAYGDAWPREAGTYGGRSEHERRPSLGRPTTHRTEHAA